MIYGGILVLGADGLLGSHLTTYLGGMGIGLTREHYGDLCSPGRVFDYIKKFRNIQVVVNCTGITPKNPDQDRMTYINAELPHKLAKFCTNTNRLRGGVKYIHISTDCVFSGLSGRYIETSLPSPQTLYGLTKLQGEVTYDRHLTIRTSFVGFPDPKGRGLLSWLRNAEEAEIPGFTDQFWNGLTTHALSKYIYQLAYSSTTGLVHLGGQKVSKYRLLCMANDIFGWQKKIIPSSGGYKDRTLKSIRFKGVEHIPGTRNQREMMQELYKWQKNNTELQ